MRPQGEEPWSGSLPRAGGRMGGMPPEAGPMASAQGSDLTWLTPSLGGSWEKEKTILLVLEPPSSANLTKASDSVLTPQRGTQSR